MVAVVAIFLLIKRPGLVISEVEDPKSFIKSCVSDALEVEEENIFKTNGYLSNIENHIVYLGEKVPYLCKASEFYVACVPQEPALIEKIRRQAEINVKQDVEDCFSVLVNSLKKKGEVDEGPMTISLKIEKGKISLKTDKRIDFTREDKKSSYNSFLTEISSPLYNLLSTSSAVVNFESTYCEFNRVGWMGAYRDISIKFFRASDQTKIYTLIDRQTEKEIKFAIKTCVLPGGI